MFGRFSFGTKNNNPGSCRYAANPTPTTPFLRRKYVKRSLYVLGCVTGIFVADLWINDEWQVVTDRFRPKLSEEERAKRPRLVILGSGWGALSFLRQLHTDKFNVTVVSPRNYFLFTPLLPSTTVGTLEVRSIMEPIRHFVKRSDAEEARFIEVECIDIDPVGQKIVCMDNSAVTGIVSKFELPFDQLVVAVGADTATFNIPGVKENALYLRDVDDVNLLRNKLLDCFETAVIPGQPMEEIQRLLSIVVVGGGPAGVEYAAELNDWLHSDLKKAFPELTPYCKIHLIEALPHILNMFDKHLIDFVETKYKNNPNIDLRTQESVIEAKEKSILIKSTLNGNVQEIPYGMLLWVTGNTPRVLIKNLIQKIGQENRRGLVVDDHLHVKGTKNIWSLGDCSWSNLPATAQVAAQQGKYLGKLFNNLSEKFHEDQQKPSENILSPKIEEYEKFGYKHLGSFAYVGDNRAIAEFKEIRKNNFTSHGLLTYALWRSVYLSKLLSARNRVSVFMDWSKAFVFGRDISRG